MQVLVIGATGTLGRQIARQALDAGHQERCMVRSPRKAAFLQEWGCELTRGDLLEPDSLAYALEGQDAVIDAATARATDSGSAYDIDWSGKQNLFAACQAAAVKRFVFVSLLDAHRHRGPVLGADPRGSGRWRAAAQAGRQGLIPWAEPGPRPEGRAPRLVPA